MSPVPPPPPPSASPSPPTAPQQAMNPWSELLTACGTGCFVLIALLITGCAVMWVKLVQPVVEHAQRMEAASEEAVRHAAEVAALDVTTPPRLTGDPATAALTDEDVSRYVRIRQDLGAPLAAIEDS